jgi:hypothetical protein
MARRGMVAAIAVAVALCSAGSAEARVAADLAGTWKCCGAGGAATQSFVITSGSGSLRGTAKLPGGRVFAAITGRRVGGNVKIVTTYNSFAPGYVATFVGAISTSGRSMSGTWTSNAHQSGTWTATR